MTLCPMGRAILLIVLMVIAGCHARRPDFMTRVQEDCAAGNLWACDLLDALSRPIPAEDIKAPDNVEEDVDAILRGIDRAKSAPRVGYPDVPLIADGLPTLATIFMFLPLLHHSK